MTNTQPVEVDPDFMPGAADLAHFAGAFTDITPTRGQALDALDAAHATARTFGPAQSMSKRAVRDGVVVEAAAVVVIPDLDIVVEDQAARFRAEVLDALRVVGVIR